MISELIFFSQFQGSKVSGGTKLLSALILISYGQQTKDGRSLFHIAVINRQESVFNLLYETVAVKETILTYVMKGKNENVMHLAGYLAPLNRLNIISRAALQMQRELLWFKVGVSMYYFSFLFLCMFTLTNLHLQNCRG